MTQLLDTFLDNEKVWPVVETQSSDFSRRFWTLDPFSGKSSSEQLIGKMNEFILTDRDNLSQTLSNFEVENNVISNSSFAFNPRPVENRFIIKKREEPSKSEVINRVKYIIRQSNSFRYAKIVLKLQSLHGHSKNIIFEALIDLFMDLISVFSSTKIPNTKALSQRIRDLCSFTIMLVLWKFMTFADILNELVERVQSSEVDTNAVYPIARIIYQYVSGAAKIDRVPYCNPDHIPCLKLTRAFFKQESSRRESSFQYTPLKLFILLYLKQHVATDITVDKLETLLKSRVVPSFLQSDAKDLVECLNFKGDFLKQVTSSPIQIAAIINILSPFNDYLPEVDNPCKRLVKSLVISDDNLKAELPGGALMILSKFQEPLSYKFLNSLTIHAKLTIFQKVKETLLNWHTNPEFKTTNPSYALIETTCRIAECQELRNSVASDFLRKNLLSVFIEHEFWQGVYSVLQIVSYRLHYIEPTTTIDFIITLINLHSASGKVQYPWELYSLLENTIITLISNASLHLWDFQRELSDFIRHAQQSEKPRIHLRFDIPVPETEEQLSNDVIFWLKSGLISTCEKINRITVLSLVSMSKVNGSVTDSSLGNIIFDIIEAVQVMTPLAFTGATLNSFPPKVKQFYIPLAEREAQKNIESIKTLTKMISNDRRQINSDMQTHHYINWDRTDDRLFCVLWDFACQSKSFSLKQFQGLPGALHNMPMKRLAKMIDVFAGYVVHILVETMGPQEVQSKIEALQDLIYGDGSSASIIPIERMIISLLLQPISDSKNSAVCCSVIQLILMNSTKHNKNFSKISNFWSRKHSNYRNHTEFHNFFQQDCMLNNPKSPPLPNYYDNICFRFTPIIDILFMRIFSEKGMRDSQVSIGGWKQFITSIVQVIYQFHPRPISYLYKIFIYYEDHIRRPSNDQDLSVQIFWNILTSKHPYIPGQNHWAISSSFMQFVYPTLLNNPALAQNQEAVYKNWSTSEEYFHQIVERLAKCIYHENSDIQIDDSEFVDYQNNEFPNQVTHVLCSTCTEILANPENPIASVCFNLVRSA